MAMNTGFIERQSHLASTTLACDTTTGVAAHVPCSRPLYIDGRFGWLHTPVDGRATSIAVLLCAGLKEDKVTGHRSLRLFADAFAAAGYPTLRFDYAGTGDLRDIGSAEPGQHGSRTSMPP